MRRVVYQALLRAPFRVASATGGVVGFIGSVWPDKVKAVIGNGIPVQPISIALLAFAAIYFVLLWLLKPGESSSGSAGGTTVTTHGPNSPGIGSVARDVHIHNHPQPAASPMPSWARERGLATYGINEKPSPDTPVWFAIHRIAARIGENNSAEGFPAARRQLRQAALNGDVPIWGQEQIQPLEMHDLNKYRDVLSRVPEGYWNDYRLNETAADEGGENAPHTEDERQPNSMMGRYWNLRLRKRDIDRTWRKPPKPELDDDREPGDNWKTI
jgi:hypothetical protein